MQRLVNSTSRYNFLSLTPLKAKVEKIKNDNEIAMARDKAEEEARALEKKNGVEATHYKALGMGPQHIVNLESARWLWDALKNTQLTVTMPQISGMFNRPLAGSIPGPMDGSGSSSVASGSCGADGQSCGIGGGR